MVTLVSMDMVLVMVVAMAMEVRMDEVRMVLCGPTQEQNIEQT